MTYELQCVFLSLQNNQLFVVVDVLNNFLLLGSRVTRPLSRAWSRWSSASRTRAGRTRTVWWWTTCSAAPVNQATGSPSTRSRSGYTYTIHSLYNIRESVRKKRFWKACPAHVLLQRRKTPKNDENQSKNTYLPSFFQSPQKVVIFYVFPKSKVMHGWLMTNATSFWVVLLDISTFRHIAHKMYRGYTCTGNPDLTITNKFWVFQPYINRSLGLCPGRGACVGPVWAGAVRRQRRVLRDRLRGGLQV